MNAPVGATSVVDRAQNRGRILTLILLATLNYCVAAVIAATLTGVVIVVWVIAKVGDRLSDPQLEELGVAREAGGAQHGRKATRGLPISLGCRPWP